MGAVHQILLAGGVTDPYLGSVKLLMPFSASTTTDSNIVQANTITTVGSPSISAATTKWGVGSLDVNAAAAEETVRIIGPSDFRTSTAASFTLEMWLYPISTATNGGGSVMCNAVLSLHSASPTTNANCVGLIWWDATSGGRIGFLNSGYYASAAPNTWHHYAYVQDAVANQRRLYCNGSQVGFSLSASALNFIAIQAGNSGAAAATANGSWQNYVTLMRMEQLRFTDGVCRYNGASYTVPTGPF